MVASTVRAAQAGIWSACASCSLYTNGTTIHWQFVSPSYNPGIIGAGTNLGPQQPLTDIEGHRQLNESGMVHGVSGGHVDCP
jgi:hypothetical protein